VWTWGPGLGQAGLSDPAATKPTDLSIWARLVTHAMLNSTGGSGGSHSKGVRMSLVRGPCQKNLQQCSYQQAPSNRILREKPCVFSN
jgi:hypothetical protein